MLPKPETNHYQAIETVSPQPQAPVKTPQEIGWSMGGTAAELGLIAAGGSAVVAAGMTGVLYGMKKWREHRSKQASHTPPKP